MTRDEERAFEAMIEGEVEEGQVAKLAEGSKQEEKSKGQLLDFGKTTSPGWDGLE